jgi:photosystem II stability/assembly factor-like uncharacterized protein
MRIPHSATTVTAFLAMLPLVAAGEDEPAAAVTEFAEIAPLAIKSLLLDGAVIADQVVVVGERGDILRSSDGGNHWDQARVPTRATLTGVWFADADHGWAVGHDEVILRTLDGGGTWELVHSAPQDKWPLLAVWFRDSVHGIAVGAYSKYLTSDDGGATWTVVPFEPQDTGRNAAEDTAAGGSPGASDDEALSSDEDVGFDVHLNRIIPAAGGRLYLPGEAGQIFRSDDAGETWLRLPSPYDGSFYGALPLEGDTVLVFGLRGNLFRSEDAGMTWTQVASGTEAMLTDGTIAADGTIILVGLAGAVLVSHDGGRSFVVDQQSDRKGYARILQLDDGFVLVGEAGVRRYAPPAAQAGAGAASAEAAR